MFDEQPRDPHGECAAEIHRLQEALRRLVDRDLRYVNGFVDGGLIRVQDVAHARRALGDPEAYSGKDDKAHATDGVPVARELPPGLIGERVGLCKLRDDVESLPLHPHKRKVVLDFISAAIEAVERELQDAVGGVSPGVTTQPTADHQCPPRPASEER